VLHAKSLRFLGHTLGLVIADLETLAGLPSAASRYQRPASGMPPTPFAARGDAEMPSSP